MVVDGGVDGGGDALPLVQEMKGGGGFATSLGV